MSLVIFLIVLGETMTLVKCWWICVSISKSYFIMIESKGLFSF